MTERLLLRPFAEADIDHLLALHSDPEVRRFISGGKPASREVIEREYHERFAGDGYWAARSSTRSRRTTGSGGKRAAPGDAGPPGRTGHAHSGEQHRVTLQ